MMKWAAAVAVVVCVLATRFAMADDDSDRASYIHDIDDKVRNIAGRLSGFDSQRDFGHADDALEYARDVSDLVHRLDNVKGSDSRANDICSRYPGYLDSFREAMKYLKKLKELQFLADGVADRCVHDEADLQSIIRNYVGNPDQASEAFEQLPRKGQELGRTYTPLLDKLRDADREVQNNASYARFDVSQDNWSDVRSYFSDSASRMVSYWHDRYSPIDSACNRLALGEKHPDIEKALSDLRSYTGSTKETVKQLKHDYNLWLADARKLREMTKEDHDEMREIMCQKGETEEDIKAKVNELADRWASQISSAYGTILGQADRLIDRASSSKLAKYKGAREVLDGIKANRATLEKVKDSDLQGSNNPRIKAKMQYGIDYHKSWSCSGIKEMELNSTDCRNPLRSGSGCRADCVTTGSTCVVIELKPDNTEAMRMGQEQASAYAQAIKNWYARDKESLFHDHSEIKNCERDGNHLEVDTHVEPYKFCPDQSEAKAWGADLDSLPSDISESGD